MVMAQSYVPDAGDIVWIGLDPQAEREQAGHRPAVVLSGVQRKNKSDGLLPDDNADQNYPFEVIISGVSPSAVLAETDRTLGG
jgi:mRNA interferase MazF